MFSYLKFLDLSNNNDVTITIYGEPSELKKYKNNIFIKFLGNASIIYENSNEDFVVVCKNQTCSQKLKNIDEIKNYIDSNLWD